MTDGFFTLKSGWRLHYTDAGAGRAVVMLHGNPTWSFMYRELSAALAARGFHAVALDHLGCGLSDKPQDADYCLKTHLENLEEFLAGTLPEGVSCDLVLHDWGGPVGVAYALRHPERVGRLVLMNTVAWPSRRFPKAIYLTKCPFLGAFLVRHLNILMRIALRRVPAKRLPAAVAAGYRRPYGSYAARIAIQRFPQDIPLGPSHPSHALFTWMAGELPALARHPVMLCWGQRDKCFPMAFLEHWREILPDAEIRVFPTASHFLLEDEPRDVTHAITEFLMRDGRGADASGASRISQPNNLVENHV